MSLQGRSVSKALSLTAPCHRNKLLPGLVEIHRGLVGGLVFDVDQAQGVGLVLRAQAGLFAGGRVFGVINPEALKQNEPIFHVLHFWFGSVNH
jgi:hypothetical protein